MVWSFSAHGSFRKCPRQWFYKKLYASSLANDPIRREAHRLSKLEGLLAWRGKIVDSVISESIVPSVSSKRTFTLDDAIRQANHLFAEQRARRMLSGEEGGFLESEYGIPLTEEMFGNALNEIHVALEKFYEADSVWSLLTSARVLIPQRTLSFRHGDSTIQVRPDLIAFYGPLAPVVFDWKVNARPLRDYWLQLVTGAIALTRCTPHRDWPNGATTQHGPHEIQLFEVQLLTGDVRVHRASAADVEEAEDFISASASEMHFACAGDASDHLGPDDLPVTSNPFTCQTCPFRKICWRSQP